MNDRMILNIIKESINKELISEKIRKGEKVYTNHEDEEKEDPTAPKEVINIIRNMFKLGLLNVSAFAQYAYPDHTPEGAQSQLRKALQGLDNEGNKSSEHSIRLTGHVANIITELMSEIVQQ
jgi:hypothetical protein